MLPLVNGEKSLKASRKPWQCKVFGTACTCTPETPIGTSMVSSEGACAKVTPPVPRRVRWEVGRSRIINPSCYLGKISPKTDFVSDIEAKMNKSSL
ncbi:MAG: hypothetical protein AB4352_12970 [Hormoscilla sp.]